ncbi:TPA: hypothetical protein DDW35_05345 [Candidatus Sumerlaeota bacterium]|jgi:hypothetical protein|nr:hypothetical protein [Candidatus Sumerlaeota bacterium]
MYSGQNVSQEDEVLAVDDYVTRLRMVSRKVLLARRRGERRELDRRQLTTDRRTHHILVAEERRSGHDRRCMAERRIGRERRDARFEIGVDFKASSSLPVSGTSARKRALFKSLLEKTDLAK